MTDLVAFLEARLAEDEATAAAAGSGEWWAIGSASVNTGPPDYDIADFEQSPLKADHALRWHPKRVLAEVAAKRKIMEHCSDYVLMRLAEVYADHPDFGSALTQDDQSEYETHDWGSTPH